MRQTHFWTYFAVSETLLVEVVTWEVRTHHLLSWPWRLYGL